MNRLFIAVLFSVIATSVWAQSKESPCWKAARTQSEMNHCADLDAREAEVDLNHVYNQLLAKLKADKNATEKLRIAQRAWLAFRDAHMQELYPAEDKQAEYGTVFPMCADLALADLTRQRMKMLKQMLNHVEGEVCSR
ncbi:MAG TPA: lysozyme inhibitor LprI family protein [Terriglobales bacterium]|nr:lysozyme inhibitor LprI family protein [Terriglobales bacterium]